MKFRDVPVSGRGLNILSRLPPRSLMFQLWKYQWYTVALLTLPLLNLLYRLHILGIYTLTPNGLAFITLVDKPLMALVFQINSIVFPTATCLEGIFTLLSVIKYYSIRNSAVSNLKKHEIRLLCKLILPRKTVIFGVTEFSFRDPSNYSIRT